MHVQEEREEGCYYHIKEKEEGCYYHIKEKEEGCYYHIKEKEEGCYYHIKEKEEGKQQDFHYLSTVQTFQAGSIKYRLLGIVLSWQLLYGLIDLHSDTVSMT